MPNNTLFMTDRTVMLCELLQLLRLNAEVYHNAKVCGDWTITEGKLGQTCFHLPVEGNCLLQIPGADTTVLNTGDMVLFPKEMPHTMVPTEPQQGPYERLSYCNAPPEAVAMLCGRMIFHHQAHRGLLDALPGYLIVRAEDSHSWLPPLLALIRHESYSAQPSSLILDRVCELIFIYILKNFSGHEQSRGILKLYSMDKIRPALETIHDKPEHNWTLDKLAQRCNMSRTVFAKKFRESGWTAIQYLTWWRMQIAWRMINNGESVLETALKVGYHSEAAFSRAFFKEFDVRPGQLRKKPAN